MTVITRFSTNQLLASLSCSERRNLDPDLEWVELAAGTLLHSTGKVPRYVYFPVNATVSLVSTMSDGASAEVAVVGSEGMVGVCAFMGDANALSDALVQRPGPAWRMTTADVLQHTRRSPELIQKLLGYTQALLTHMAQSLACNRHHALDQQLCRWLLEHLDRQQGSELQITQERIGSLLGVRREGVTGSALKLQRAGLIEYRRGHITVIDRDGLDARSCECYRVVQRAYQRLSCAYGAPQRIPFAIDGALTTPAVVHRQPMQPA